MITGVLLGPKVRNSGTSVSRVSFKPYKSLCNHICGLYARLSTDHLDFRLFPLEGLNPFAT